MVAGGGLGEDEKKADRERQRERAGGRGCDGGRRGCRTKGGRPSFADVVEDEASESVRGMRRLRERYVGQILFPPTSATSRRRNMTGREDGARYSWGRGWKRRQEEDTLRPYFSRGSIVIFIDWIPRSPGSVRAVAPML